LVLQSKEIRDFEEFGEEMLKTILEKKSNNMAFRLSLLLHTKL
jgi:hypothetical protein